jgi:hypothetical protein
MNSRLGIWAIDSGASHNYCNDLTEIKKDSITEANMIIKLGDKNEVHVRKKGMVQLNGNGTCAIIDHLGDNLLSATLDRGLYNPHTTRFRSRIIHRKHSEIIFD